MLSYPGPPPNPLEDESQFLDWLAAYLLPKPLGGAGFRAHQFTINGLTYPFVRFYNFAGVPDVPKNRRYDMFAGLHLVRPGDLIYFFQADPQDPRGGIGSRRGILGIYRAESRPFRSPGPIHDEASGLGFTLLDKCPSCGSFQAMLSFKCVLCGNQYPPTDVIMDGEPRPALVVSSHLRISPLFAFELPVSDERAYADFSDEGLVWIGRHDNAMGPGKGSSIRQLLPEEAVKLARLLSREPDQRIGNPATYQPPMGAPLNHPDGGPEVDFVPTKNSGEVQREDELYFILARQVDEPNSPFRRYLAQHFPTRVTWDHLEYVSSNFPWGYTGGNADFMLVFRGPEGRDFVVIVECKPDTAHDRAVLQAMLYVERALQVAFLKPGVAPPGEVEVLPLVLAKGLRRVQNGSPKLAVPTSYSIERAYWGGGRVKARIRSPIMIAYVPPAPSEENGAEFRRALDYDFTPVNPAQTGSIQWEAHPSSVGTGLEMDHILRTSWAAARTAAGV